jgi:hypothetical protein
VENKTWSDVAVYLLDDNVPFRLGTVAALHSARLAVPHRTRTTGVRLAIRTFAANEIFVPEPVLLGAGGVVELVVHPLLTASQLSVLSYGAYGP